jgi:hypothetical protein
LKNLLAGFPSFDLSLIIERFTFCGKRLSKDNFPILSLICKTLVFAVMLFETFLSIFSCSDVEFGIKTKTCGAKSGLKIGSLNPKTDLWQI